MRSYHNGAFLWQWYFDQCAATLKYHAADTGHDTPSCYSIQTQGRPLAVLSIDVKHYTGINNHLIDLNVFGLTRLRNPDETRLSTHALNAWLYQCRCGGSQSEAWKKGYEPGTCFIQICYAIRYLLLQHLKSEMVIHTPITRGRSSIDTDRANVRRLYP